MEKKLITQLVEGSFRNNEIDGEIVNSIADKLNKSQLREYIKQLKKYLAGHTVRVETAFPIGKTTEKELEERYSNKKINYVINKNLILGIKIYEDDVIYSKNLKDSLEDIQNYLTK